MLGNLCKVHRDKSHFVATKHCPSVFIKKKGQNDLYKSIFDIAFEECIINGIVDIKHKEHYSCFVRADMKYNKKVFDYIYARFEEYKIVKPDYYFIENINRKLNAFYLRRKRFVNKINFYANTKYWNYFVTFTRDDKLYSNFDSWLTALKRTLSKLAYRRGWRFVMVQEVGELKQRRHLHGVFHIPQGQMVGRLIVKDMGYNFKKHKRQKTVSNTFFSKFGNNEFDKIDYMGGNVATRILNYMTKYMDKSPEKFIYSRGINDTVDVLLHDSQFVCQSCKYNNLQYVVADDVDIFTAFMNSEAMNYERKFFYDSLHVLNYTA